MSDPRFSESDKDFDSSQLSPEARRTLEAAQRSAEKEFSPDKEIAAIMEGDGIKAGYKIEIHFGPSRTPNGPNNVCIQIFESGKRFDGGGDDKMYWCRDVRRDHNEGCGKPIPSSAMFGGVAMCPSCGAAINSSFLMGEQFQRLDTSNLASKIEQIFIDLKHNADIYCKYHPSDIRYQAVMKEKGFEKARYLRGLFIYPLKNILKDTVAGSTLQARFKAFLSA